MPPMILLNKLLPQEVKQLLLDNKTLQRAACILVQVMFAVRIRSQCVASNLSKSLGIWTLASGLEAICLQARPVTESLFARLTSHAEWCKTAHKLHDWCHTYNR